MPEQGPALLFPETVSLSAMYLHSPRLTVLAYHPDPLLQSHSSEDLEKLSLKFYRIQGLPWGLFFLNGRQLITSLSPRGWREGRWEGRRILTLTADTKEILQGMAFLMFIKHFTFGP